MRELRRTFLICATVLLTALIAISFLPAEKWTVTWSDEFNYKGLPDSTKWGYDVGGYGFGNNELQYYTARRAENARVEDGKLIIEARREVWQNNFYTSARLVTKGKADWKYGKLEVRAKLPRGRGTWPAIWMLSSKEPMKWPNDGEIDIMEHVGYNHGIVYGSTHSKKYNHVIGTQKTDSIPVADCSDNFRTYGVEWDADSVRISVDANVYFTFKNEHTGYEAWPFDNKMYLLLNVAVGGNWGGAKGVDETIWPQRMEIDYVRYYTKQ
ncbi:MAG: glycoside hydrolase family 16 protein [Gemmatimonadaceae bacterium]|nr:glycoside hydrolase family 16 protein [Chitinophagaceae bacterium]